MLCYCMVCCGSFRYGSFMISPVGTQVRLDRIAFSGGECELALEGREVCKQYRLECHHKDDESYVKDRKGTITINDVLMVCTHCHDELTEHRRQMRKRRSFTCSLEQETESKVRHGLARATVSVDIGFPTADEERTDRKSVEQIRKGIQGS